MKEKSFILIEFIIKAIFAIISIIASIFVLSEAINMFGLFKVYSLEEDQIYGVIYKTHYGPIFKGMGVFESIDNNVIKTGILAFIYNIRVISIIMLVLLLLLLCLHYIFPRWNLIKSNSKICSFIVLFYILKNILFGVSFLIFYQDNLQSIQFSIVFGTVVYLIFALLELICLLILIIKFVFNFANDIKNIVYLEN